jgi:hypothetical protein
MACRVPRRAHVALLLGAAMLAGCAFLRAPIANPEGLPDDAQTLRYVLDRGCFAYMLGEKSEADAMHALRLTHHGPGLNLTPPGPPFWLGSYPGLSNVVAGRDSCSVNMRGRDADAYRTATELVLKRRFGDAQPLSDPAYPAVLPGQRTGCRRSVRYTYYPDRVGFSVDLNRVDCAADPMHGAHLSQPAARP